MARATIKDVAARAGVSPSTVSRALANPHLVRDETVRRVREAAKSLRYVYNATAGSLSSRRSDCLAVIIPSSAYSAFAINLMGIQEVCAEHNYSCRIASTQFQPEKERQAMKKCHEQRVAGLIMAGIDPANISYLRAMMADGIPAMVLWEQPDEDISHIGIDNFRAAHEGVSYLLSLGHRRIALISGPFACAKRNVDRLAGYRKALEEGGVEYRPELVRSQLPTFLHGKEAMRACLRLHEPPTAALCVNDYLAIGAMRAISEAGLCVPDDVSVCGFDDVDISAYFNPPITTIKTPGQEMGRMAGEAMIRAIENGNALDVQYTLDAELVIRNTCAPRRTE